MITFAIEALILVVLLVVLYVLNRTERLSKVTYDEEIVPYWLTKEDVRELLKNKDEKISMRTQSVLYLWSTM